TTCRASKRSSPSPRSGGPTAAWPPVICSRRYLTGPAHHPEAAAVYAASEGLRVVAIESVAPGGQAGTTSMIENYLGFPQGISGSELATRAAAQARRFGAEVLLARRLADISREGPGYVACLSDGTTVRSRAMLVASGVEWRRLEVPG